MTKESQGLKAQKVKHKPYCNMNLKGLSNHKLHLKERLSNHKLHLKEGLSNQKMEQNPDVKNQTLSLWNSGTR